MLNTNWGEKAYKLYPDRKLVKTSNVKYGPETSVYESCSITWKNEFFVFGGNNSDKKQISKMVGCKLTRIGSLDFDHFAGTCSNMNNRLLYVCFDYGNAKKCRLAADPLDSFIGVQNSTFEHKYARIAISEKSKFSKQITIFKKIKPFCWQSVV